MAPKSFEHRIDFDRKVNAGCSSTLTKLPLLSVHSLKKLADVSTKCIAFVLKILLPGQVRILIIVHTDARSRLISLHQHTLSCFQQLKTRPSICNQNHDRSVPTQMHRNPIPAMIASVKQGFIAPPQP
jgi:hypothetical protein